MKAILKSIRPKHVQKILSGYKKIEIDKKMPKCELPIEVYIYCTEGEMLVKDLAPGYGYRVKNKIHSKSKECKHWIGVINGKVVAKFTLNKVSPVVVQHAYNIENNEKIMKAACLEPYQFWAYLGNNPDLYAWHISDLVIFNKPMELSTFNDPCIPTVPHEIFCGSEECGNFVLKELLPPYNVERCEKHNRKQITRAPQSWQYVEVKNG